MGKKGGGNEAAQARADEQARQQKIREGTARINSIFDGQTVGSGKLDSTAVFDPNAKYYLENGSVWSPTAAPAAPSGGLFGVIGGGGGGSPSPQYGVINGSGAATGREYAAIPSAPSKVSTPAGKTPQQQFAEMLSGGKLFSGTEQTPGFNEDYFNKQRQNYIDLIILHH